MLYYYYYYYYYYYNRMTVSCQHSPDVIFSLRAKILLNLNLNQSYLKLLQNTESIY